MKIRRYKDTSNRDPKIRFYEKKRKDTDFSWKEKIAFVFDSKDNFIKEEEENKTKKTKRN